MIDDGRDSPERIEEVREMNAQAERIFTAVAYLVEQALRQLQQLPDHPDYGDYEWDSTGQTLMKSAVGDLRSDLFSAERCAVRQRDHAKSLPRSPAGLSNMSFFLAFARRLRAEGEPAHPLKE